MMSVNDKVVMEMGQHGHVGYFEGYVLIRYTDGGRMEPIAVTADKNFAEAYLSGTEEWPDDGVGVIRVLALTDENT